MNSFGEIVEPSTRTAWEDWDEVSAVERNITELKWHQSLESPKEINTFLLVEGKFLTDCVKNQTSNIELINAVPEVHLQLFRSKVSNEYICTVKDYNLLLSSEIVELLWQHLVMSKNVIALQTKALSEYQAMENFNQGCIIRSVTTIKSTSSDFTYPKLEQPNMISGVAAGVISLRDHLDKPGTALVCYMEHPEEFVVEDMEKLLEKLSISQNSKSRPNTVLNSNLYI